MLNFDHYTIIAHWFPRLLGLVYFFAFGAFLFQIRGLIGRHGILPIADFFSKLSIYYPNKHFLYVPSLFWLNHSDAMLMGVTAMGTVVSILLLFGIWPPLMLFLLYILYISIISAGQDFLGFGWEGFLLEVTVHAFLLSLTVIPNPAVWLSVNFLLFRFHFQAGAVKFQSKDPTWLNFTALSYHYQTQPIPNTIAWYVHKLPLWFHKLSAIIMFLIEMVIPIGIFFTDDIRFATFIAFFGLQLMIWGTGNFSFLNYLTLVLTSILISNKYLTWLLNAPAATPTPLYLDIFLYAAGSILLILQLLRFWHHFFPDQTLGKLFTVLSPYHLVNRYGIFAVMTTTRYEIVVEGSDDGIEWKEYTFKHKPSEITRRPKRIAPYQPRIDWQIWFLPFSNFRTEGWFQKFLAQVLMGNKTVLKLIRHNPFPDHPPKYVRSLVYIYEFSTPEEKKKYGWWWHRKLIGQYSPSMMLK